MRRSHLSRLSLGFAAAAIGAALSAPAAMAQTLSTSGTQVVVPASAEVRHPNDQAVIVLAIEEQDKDKAAAASRVNLKMKQGIEIVKKEDPQASLKTQGYYTYAVYPEERPQNGAAARPRVPSGWRVGQSLQVTTSNLNGLPKTVAAAQRILTLNGLHFGLTPQTLRKLDDQRIAATYQDLNERIAAIASAMGRKLGDVVLDVVDFEGSGNFVQRESFAAPMAARASMMKDAAPVEEPSFEPGETALQMQVVGKLHFK